MKTKITATLTAGGLSLIINGSPRTISQTHINFQRIINALKNKDYDAIPDLIDIASAVTTYTKGLVTITNGVVYYGETPMHNALTTRMLRMVELGLDVSPMAKFLENLMKNPSYNSVTELYGFMEACDLPITEDGCLLAYRSVRMDYLDQHTGKTCYSWPYEKVNTKILEREFTFEPDEGVFYRTVNGVSTVVDRLAETVRISMQRNLVDDNRNQTCSKGLHVCSQKYPKYGQRLLLVKINPADVVSVPTDYSQSKMRVCAFEVVKDLGLTEYKSFNSPIYFEEDDFDPEWDF